MSAEVTKRCPKCGEKDITSFSSCRFCGTKYDAVIAAPKKEVNFNVGDILRSWPGLIIVIAILVVCRDLITDAIMFVAVKSEITKREKAAQQSEQPGGRLHAENGTVNGTETATETEEGENAEEEGSE